MNKGKRQKWVGTTFGNGWMHEKLTAVLRWMDIRFIYVFAAVFVVPVCLFLPTTRHSYVFFRQALNYNIIKSCLCTYKNLVLFSQVVIDRFAMYAGKVFNVEVLGYENFEKLAKSNDGFVQLSAHVGNYELAGYSLIAKDKPMNALVFAGEKESVMKARQQMFSNSYIKMIPIQSDMSHIFVINNALASGEIVSMPADRKVGSLKGETVDFFCKKVSLPEGPFRIAVLRNAPVLAVNVMKKSMKSYIITVTPLCYDTSESKKQQQASLAQAYANELEKVIKQHPCQWYNYFDFWNQ